jgi:hypothetical protein
LPVPDPKADRQGVWSAYAAPLIVRGRACRAKRNAAAADAVLWERLRETLAFALDALVFRLCLPCYIPFAELEPGKVLYLFEDYALDSK